jgi:hypothetical protein
MATTIPGHAPAPAPATPPPPRRRFLIGRGGWRTTLGEFAIIVAGVLAALGAQAWWEARGDAAREADYLRQIAADVAENEARLGAAIATDSAAHDAVDRLVRAFYGAGGAGPLPPPDTVVGWLLAAGAVADFQPVTGALEALLSTGDLRLVRSDALRAGLVAYGTLLDGEVRRSAESRATWFAAIGPLVAAFPFMRGLFLGDVATDAAELERIRAAPDAAAVLVTVQALGLNRLNALRRARAETARLRELLEAATHPRPAPGARP